MVVKHFQRGRQQSETSALSVCLCVCCASLDEGEAGTIQALPSSSEPSSSSSSSIRLHFDFCGEGGKKKTRGEGYSLKAPV